MPTGLYYKTAQKVESLEFKGSNQTEMIAFCPLLSIRESDGVLIFMGHTEILPTWWVFKDTSTLEWYYSATFDRDYQRNP